MIYLDECPPFPEEMLEQFRELGICEDLDALRNTGSFEVTLELSEHLSLSLDRETRPQAIEAVTELDRLMHDEYLVQGEVAADVLFFPDDEEPACLATRLQIEGVGAVTLFGSAPDLRSALSVMHRVVPGAYINS